ncbi:glycoside hydrolase family 16 protein, partial [Teratosphaeria destructans]
AGITRFIWLVRLVVYKTLSFQGLTLSHSFKTLPMQLSTIITSLVLMSTTGWCSYVLEDDYLKDGTFFDLFTFYTSSDPTNGFVEYQSQSAASSAGLLSSSTTNVQMKVDSTNVTPSGRPSVRITSNKSYNTGLFIADIEHMPGGVCGTWPAFWLVGPNWPDEGEIDIIEGVNQQTSDEMTLHTGPGCTVTDNNDFSGSLVTDNCYVDAAGQSANAGCQITTSNTQTYGAGFNSNNGGVYATEWTDSAISIYFFPRGSIPSDITSGSLDPSSWGTPLASFHGGCDIASNFTDMQIVFDTTFCGDWAGAVWSSGSCASQASTCNSFVENNPSAFTGAYWSINALQVYSMSSNGWNDVANSSTAGSTASTAAVAASTSSDALSPAETSSASAIQTTFAISSKAPVATSTSATSPSSSSSSTATTASSAEAQGGWGWTPWVDNSGRVEWDDDNDVAATTTTTVTVPHHTQWAAFVDSDGEVEEGPDGVGAHSVPEAVQHSELSSAEGKARQEPGAAEAKRYLRHHHKRHGGAGLR